MPKCKLAQSQKRAQLQKRTKPEQRTKPQKCMQAQQRLQAEVDERLKRLRCELEADDSSPFDFLRSLPPQLPPLPKGSICIPEKAPGTPRFSLVLDLDETLVHSSLSDEGHRYNLVFDVGCPDVPSVHVLKRPHVDMFLERVSQIFEVIVFTAAETIYADRVLDMLDPGRKWISHRAFRSSCTPFEGTYVKDLRVLGRDLATTAIVDNSIDAFGLHLDNGIPITSWFDDPTDNALLRMLPFLERISRADDARPLIRRRFHLNELVHGVVGADEATAMICDDTEIV